MEGNAEQNIPADKSQDEQQTAIRKPVCGTVSEEEKEAIAREYPDYLKDGELKLPEDVVTLNKGGMDALTACRVGDLKRTKELCARLSAKLDADNANRANAAASIGRLSGGEAAGKDYYTSKEWDKLSKKEKEKFIKSGKVYEFIKKWSGK